MCTCRCGDKKSEEKEGRGRDGEDKDAERGRVRWYPSVHITFSVGSGVKDFLTEFLKEKERGRRKYTANASQNTKG